MKTYTTTVNGKTITVSKETRIINLEGADLEVELSNGAYTKFEGCASSVDVTEWISNNGAPLTYEQACYIELVIGLSMMDDDMSVQAAKAYVDAHHEDWADAMKHGNAAYAFDKFYSDGTKKTEVRAWPAELTHGKLRSEMDSYMRSKKLDAVRVSKLDSLGRKMFIMSDNKADRLSEHYDAAAKARQDERIAAKLSARKGN